MPAMSRRFQFSLKTIFLLTALAAVLCLVVPPVWRAMRSIDDVVFPMIVLIVLVPLGILVNIINIVRD